MLGVAVDQFAGFRGWFIASLVQAFAGFRGVWAGGPEQVIRLYRGLGAVMLSGVPVRFRFSLGVQEIKFGGACGPLTLFRFSGG